ncbi:MAG: molybdenum cofactor biosynthesis protein MoaE [Gammaproteobacteria bacterium]
MTIEIRLAPFDPLRELAYHQESLATLRGQYGATASFIGTMRDLNEGDTVRAMTLEYYPGMSERHLERTVDAAMARWPILEALVIHRVGELHPNDPIVLVAVWSAHRAAAFDACRFIMEDLKSKAPFWKKEALVEGERWVEKNTPG